MGKMKAEVGRMKAEVGRMKAGEAFPKGVARPAQRALASIGVTRLDQAARFTERELMELHGMGPRALDAIREK